MRFLRKKNKDDYYFPFQGMILTRLETKKLSIGFVSGFIGIILLLLLPFQLNKYVSFFILLFFFTLGYFIISPRIFKDVDD